MRDIIGTSSGPQVLRSNARRSTEEFEKFQATAVWFTSGKKKQLCFNKLLTLLNTHLGCANKQDSNGLVGITLKVHMIHSKSRCEHKDSKKQRSPTVLNSAGFTAHLAGCISFSSVLSDSLTYDNKEQTLWQRPPHDFSLLVFCLSSLCPSSFPEFLSQYVSFFLSPSCSAQ